MQRRYRVECEVWAQQLTPDLTQRLHSMGVEVREHRFGDYVAVVGNWPARSAVEAMILMSEVLRQAGLPGPIDLLVVLPY